MNDKQGSEIVRLIKAISQVDFVSGRRNSDQYVFPIQRILRQAGFKTRTEYPVRYPEWYAYRNGYIDLFATKGNTRICIEIDYKTVKHVSILKISQVWKATPVFVLTYEGEPASKSPLKG